MAPRLLVLLIALLACLGLSLAATPTSFCKCTCFGNSTIVALNAPVTTAHPALDLRPRAAKKAKTCNDCNRQFCLSYSFCKSASDKDDNVSATCFQRDSTKDQVVVLCFIAATLGLLLFAAVRPWVDQWRDQRRNQRPYVPVSTHADR